MALLPKFMKKFLMTQNLSLVFQLVVLRILLNLAKFLKLLKNQETENLPDTRNFVRKNSMIYRLNRRRGYFIVFRVTHVEIFTSICQSFQRYIS